MKWDTNKFYNTNLKIREEMKFKFGDNISKNKKSSITIEELINRIREFEEKYNKNITNDNF